MFHTFTNHKFVLRFSLSASRVSICIRLVLGGKDNWRIRYRLFLSNQRKHFFHFFFLEKLIICFPVRLCVRDKLGAEVQTFWKTHNFLPSSQRNANKFSNWAAFTARWLFLSNKGIWHWWHAMSFGDPFPIMYTLSRTSLRAFPH